MVKGPEGMMTPKGASLRGSGLLGGSGGGDVRASSPSASTSNASSCAAAADGSRQAARVSRRVGRQETQRRCSDSRTRLQVHGRPPLLQPRVAMRQAHAVLADEVGEHHRSGAVCIMEVLASVRVGPARRRRATHREEPLMQCTMTFSPAARDSSAVR